MRGSFVVVLSLVTLSACAAAPGARSELDQARWTLALVRSSPNAPRVAQKVQAAEAAMAYAEFEARESPNDPLNAERAHQALVRATEARAACGLRAP